VICALACATSPILQILPFAFSIRAEDRDGDGRPDIWRLYDDRGALVEVDIDTNRDGAADVKEHYHHGILTRRESDRDFNGQIDLVEDFSDGSRGDVRVLMDVDYDGAADQLVVFHNGRRVLVKEVAGGTAAAGRRVGRSAVVRRGRQGSTTLVALSNPFRDDTTVAGTTWSEPDSWVPVSTSRALPADAIQVLAPGRAPSRQITARLSLLRSTIASRAPRGPPLS
jgi:hypothetical protein